MEGSNVPSGLRENEIGSVLDSLNAIVWRGNPATYEFTYVSAAAERILGYPVSSWVDDPTFWAEHMHPDDREWALKFCVDNTQALKDHDFEYRMIDAQGRTVWLKDIVHLIVRDGKPAESVGVMLDITDQKEATEFRRRWQQAQENQHRALQLNDDIVQGLAAAKYALDLELGNQAQQVIGDTLGKAQRIVGELLERATDQGLQAGDLIRDVNPDA